MSKRRVCKALRRQRMLSLLGIFGILTLIFLMWVLRDYTFLTVNGVSMAPTLEDSDILLARNLTDTEQLTYGVYVAKVKDSEGKDNLAIKRLVGLPGDTIELRDGDTYRNGTLISKRTTSSWDTCLYAVGEGQYFLLGDNRAESYDGRFWDTYYISREQLKCKVVLRLAPLPDFGKVK